MLTREDIRRVQNFEASWKDMLPEKILTSIDAYAKLKMVPIDIVTLPMLSLCASLMGHSTIKVDNKGLIEPAILWTIAVQPKGMCAYIFITEYVLNTITL